MAPEDRLEAGEVHRGLVAQLLPGGAYRGHHVVALHQELLGVGDPLLSDVRQARGRSFDGSSDDLPPLQDILGVAAPEVFDDPLLVGRQERAQLADVLL